MSETNFLKERRVFPRFAIPISVRYTAPDLILTIETSTHDISAEGLGLFLDKPLNVGTKLEVCLRMADNGEEIFVKGKIVWINPISSDKYRLGVKLESSGLQPIPLVLRTIQSRLKSYPSSR